MKNEQLYGANVDVQFKINDQNLSKAALERDDKGDHRFSTVDG